MKGLILKLIAIIFVITIVVGAFIVGYYTKRCGVSETETTISNVVTPKPLEKYQIENLAKSRITKGEIEIIEVIEEEDEYTSYLFEFSHDPTLSYNSGFKKTTGQINIPQSEDDTKLQRYPAILMLRGYIDQERYETGDGTKNAAGYFAANGFITVAPDFLGYAGSDPEAGNIFESRFQTYTTALSLLKTLETKDKYTLNNKSLGYWDEENIFIWGHSNGGQIALTILEISKKDYPTTLWAPVSKNFPYSILYYTDESDDRGKLIRNELAKFEENYDVEKYSLANHLDWLNAPLQIHQGTADDAVPLDWTEDLTEKLDDLSLDFDYFTYPGADHNMRPAWNTVVSRDLSFFQANIK